MSVTSQSVKQADLTVCFLPVFIFSMFVQQTNKQTNRSVFEFNGTSQESIKGTLQTLWPIVITSGQYFYRVSSTPNWLPGGTPTWKERECSSKRYQDPVFCGRGLPESFSPLRGTNSYITNYVLSHFFCSIPEKGTQISSRGSLEAENPKRNQNCFFDP